MKTVETRSRRPLGEPESAGRDEQPVTELLRRFSQGDREAGNSVIRVIGAELRQIASQHMRKERKDHTLQTTALVNEAYLRLLGSGAEDFKDRNHFLALASTVMRCILVDYARARGTQKRDGRKVEVDAVHLALGPVQPQVLDVDFALQELALLAPRQAQLVELRFFGGLSLEECAGVLGVAPRTADKDWSLARAWLRRRLRTVRPSES